MESVDFNNMRRAMVDSQLRTSGVTEPWIVATMASVARERFVPDALRTTAYMDRAIALPGGKTLNPPLSTALMLQAAEVKADDKILLIGAPQGYVATLLSARAKQLVVSETLSDLPETARKGGFSLIIVDGAVEDMPGALVALATEDARIVTGVNERGVTRLAIGYVRGGNVALRPFIDSEITPLPEFAHKAEFVF
jgi:protein-L-isoaspartate(D-aspartate) O-methyltransferase